jgi:hypothetical protein
LKKYHDLKKTSNPHSTPKKPSSINDKNRHKPNRNLFKLSQAPKLKQITKNLQDQSTNIYLLQWNKKTKAWKKQNKVMV